MGTTINNRWNNMWASSAAWDGVFGRAEGKKEGWKVLYGKSSNRGNKIMQFIVGRVTDYGLGSESHFDKEVDAVSYANRIAQSNAGSAVAIYKVYQVMKTEPLAIQDIKVETIEGDLVKFLEDFSGVKDSDDYCEYEDLQPYIIS